MSPLGTRLGIAVAVVAVTTPFLAFLISREATLEPPAPSRDARSLLVPPTVGLVFSVGSRVADLELLGAPPDVRRRAAETFERLDRRRDDLVGALAQVHDQTLADVLCPHDLPVFYRAALLLVTGPAGATKVRAPADDPAFGTAWDGFVRSDVMALFDAWEVRNPARDPHDALLAVSALVLGRTEDAVGERQGPWVHTTAEGGSFDDVVAQHEDAARLVGDYLALAHVLGEIVAEDPVRYGCEVAVRGAP